MTSCGSTCRRATRIAWPAPRGTRLHGVVGADPERESLNLRFGLHSHGRARAEVYGRWVDAACDAEGPAGDDGRGVGESVALVCVICCVCIVSRTMKPPRVLNFKLAVSCAGVSQGDLICS